VVSRNNVFTEYDEYLEEQKTDIAKKKILNNPDVLATRKMDREIDQADQEVIFSIMIIQHIAVFICNSQLCK